MEAVVDEVRAIVQRHADAKVAFQELRKIITKHLPRRKWDRIRFPILYETDVLEARKWIDDTAIPYGPAAIAIALHPGGEHDGLGKNALLMTTKASGIGLQTAWDTNWEGPSADHLIWGLFELHKSYSKFGLEYPASLAADYVLYLGYSGLVLADAAERSSVRNCDFVWGFGEERPFPLCRASASGVIRTLEF